MWDNTHTNGTTYKAYASDKIYQQNKEGGWHGFLTKTPANVRRSTRLSRPLERLCPSLYYLLISDSSELECYEEVMQVETIKKLDQGMNEEMESLVRN